MNLNHPPSSFFTFKANVQPISAPSGSRPPNGRAFAQSRPSILVNCKTSTEAPVISLCSAFNATAPANHLPAELVIKVLTSGAWSYWWELVALTHICQHWRNVALGTPELWRDAACSGLKGRTSCFGRDWLRPVFSFLPTLLARSAPLPLRIELPQPSILAPLLAHDLVGSYFGRLFHLSVNVQYPSDVAEVLQIVPSRIRTVETLHILHANRPEGTRPIYLDNVPSWQDADLPHLHTLTIPGLCFTSAIAVASLRTLVMSDRCRSHDVFLAALARCSRSLRSLTLLRWTHQDQPTKAPASTTSVVPLLALRRFELALDEQLPDLRPPSLLFASLSLPQRVAIHINWCYFAGNTHELVPKHVVGLHTPPFFDSVSLHLSGRPYEASVHCFLGGTECLSVRAIPEGDRRRFITQFLDQHRFPAATQLAVDLDVFSRDEYMPLVQDDVLRRFVGDFPDLRRLDLLGNTIGHAKLSMAKAFLDLPPNPAWDHPRLTATRSTAAPKTLGYVCEVSEQCKLYNATGFVDVLRAQLDALEALLADSVATSGSRLHRLELCIMCTPFKPHPPPEMYPYVYEVSASTELTSYVSSTYLLRFGRRLVDEVVFVGDVKRRGAGYRILTGAARQVTKSRHFPGSRGVTTNRSARTKGR